MIFCALLRPFALICALLRTCVCAVLFCAHLRSFADTLRASAFDRVQNDRIWGLQIDIVFEAVFEIAGAKL